MENLNLIISGEFKPPKLKKDRTEYYNKYNNCPENKQKRKLMRLMKEKQKKEQANEIKSKYYKAEAIKVLMSLKEYTEFNSEKKKKWLNFIWTFKDLNEAGFFDIIQIMKIREEADNLIEDYWETAQNEVRKGKSWNSLDYDQQQRLIKYWGHEKAHQEQRLAAGLAQQEKQGKEYEKDIEIAKFHEERGKIKCKCWKCEEQKKLQAKFQAKELTNQDPIKRVECSECGRKVKELDEESGVCKKCLKAYGGEI